jgi:serine acetyltransferase
MIQFRSTALSPDAISALSGFTAKPFAEQADFIRALADDFLTRHPDWKDFAREQDPSLKKYGKGDEELLRQELLNYPGIKVLSANEAAHALYQKNPKDQDARALSEAAASLTGADIHPGARLHPYVFIDHAKGVVIGETASVGEGTLIFHDVTLGGVSGDVDVNGNRHPQIGKHVILSAGTQIMGAKRVGDAAKIGPACQVVRTHIGVGAVLKPSTCITDVPEGIADNMVLIPRGQQLFFNSKANKNATPDGLATFVQPQMLNVEQMGNVVQQQLQR